MKRILSMLFVCIMLFTLVSCKESENNADEMNTATSAETGEVVLPEKKLGEAIETDIVRITLINAEFTIKLNSSSSGTYEQIQSGKTTLSDKYFTAEEYDAKNDAGKAYVAKKGHTYIAIEYKAENLDRGSTSFASSMTVLYDGKTYEARANYGCKSSNGYKWERYSTAGGSLLAGEEGYYRCYLDIPVDVADLDANFDLIFSLRNSKGENEEFKYVVTASDRDAVASKEISVEEAMYSFVKEEGQTYFKNHMNDYAVLSGDEIQSALNGIKKNVLIKEDTGSWQGAFRFEADGRIQETIPLVGVGYFNGRTWSISGDSLVLKAKDEVEECQVRRIKEGAYLLVKDNAPYALFN